MFMYHRTKVKNLKGIQKEGLKGMHTLNGLTEAGSWADKYYGKRPIYLSLDPERFETDGDLLLQINVDGLDLVADLPSLVDHAANIDEDNDGIWWEEGQEPDSLVQFIHPETEDIHIDDFLNPNSPVAKAAIDLTQTAATLSDIKPSRISVL